MTREQKISYILANMAYLEDDRVDVLSEVVQGSLQPTVFQTLPEDRKAKIRRAVQEIKAGNTLSMQEAFPAIAHKIAELGL